jgi:hypothetical protein
MHETELTQRRKGAKTARMEFGIVLLCASESLRCYIPTSSPLVKIVERGCLSRSTPDDCEMHQNLDALDAVEAAAAGTAALRFGCGFAALWLCVKMEVL